MGIWTRVYQTSADQPVHSHTLRPVQKCGWPPLPTQNPVSITKLTVILCPCDPCQALRHQEPAQGLSHTCRQAASTRRQEKGGAGKQEDKGKEQVERPVLAVQLPPGRNDKEGFCPTYEEEGYRQTPFQESKGQLINELALHTLPYAPLLWWKGFLTCFVRHQMFSRSCQE